ncbi:MAG: hypothetical protein HQK56_17835 [Deltaproteobacteria bacterium]|nr:hypothetical protein [Deltaproteobacteria bacterium]
METAHEEFIKVPAEVAQAFNAAGEAEREKVAFLMRFWLTNEIDRNTASLFEVMNEISDEAEAKGLTPEILNEILNEKA